MKRNLKVFTDADAVAQAACDEIVRCEGDAISKRGTFHIALSGGSTPRRLHTLLVNVPEPAPILPAWHVWFGDERWVPMNHAESNYRMARETLLDPAHFSSDRVHRIHTELDTPQEAARTYAAEMRSAFAPEAPRLDVVLLGLGDDGHTASLFPDSTAMDAAADELVVATHLSSRGTWRVTLTLTALAAARRVIFLVTGSAKAEALKRVFHESPATLPAALVARFDSNPLWLVDEAAASALG